MRPALTSGAAVGDRIRIDVDLAGQQGIERRRRAAVGHMHQIDLRLRLEPRAEQVPEGSAAARGDVDAAGRLSRLRHQVGEGLVR